ncbi:hypothetical protein D3C71_19050 [compost metagenome]
MGWWGFGIIESDNAMDWESDFEERAGIDPDWESTGERRRQGLQVSLPKLLEMVSAINYGEDQSVRMDKAMGYQVLASMLMEAGCAFSEDVRQQLLAGAADDGEYRMGVCTPQQVHERLASLEYSEAEIVSALQAHAGKRIRGRTEAIGGLLQQLRDYPITGGVSMPTPRKGLLETIATASY